ncbi:MAG: lipoyl synthase [Candidatus Gastranaerophilaceae bacterium]|jgi:lipoic acid synthetase
MKRLPAWLKRGIIDTDKTRFVRKILKEKCLNTVCDSARCPNKNECYSSNTATFLILGDTCTRNCRFCSVKGGKPQPLNPDEPQNVAIASKEMGLKYVVITSVTRDDLPDGGAEHFAKTIKAIKILDQDIKIEVLTPDFQGKTELIDIIIQAEPDVINHNVETVKRLYSSIRPQADYFRSLAFLKYVKENSEIQTKTGIMVGLGEKKEEIIQTLKDIKAVDCDIVTIGQYIQPTLNHVNVERYLEPDEYKELEEIARQIGIKKPVFGPLVRSSYKARDVF